MKERGRFYRARLAVLLSILLVVVVYAWHDVRQRRARKAWDHTLDVAIVLVREGAVDPIAIDDLKETFPVLESRLAEELHRYRPTAPKPFSFTLLGPVDSRDAAPALPGAGVLDLAKHQWALHEWTSDVDARGALSVGGYDSRVYVTLRPPSGKRVWVEGASEQGGRVGTVTVDLDTGDVDLVASVIAHELFHTLDATDKYDSSGRAVAPDGLAEPELSPRYPQRFVEIMARGRPIAPGDEVLLQSIGELAVGPATAEEIGWLKKE